MTQIFTTAQIKRLKDWDAEQLKTDMPLLITGRPEDKQFEAVADLLQDHCRHLSFHKKESKDTLPGFSITKNILFSALPMEKELEPFLNALSLKQGNLPDADHQDLKLPDAIPTPVELTLYIALMCPHCPGMVNTLVPLAMNHNNIRLTIIDGTLFEENARKDNILSAPTLILDDGFRWTGQVPAQEIIGQMTRRDPSRLGPQTLRNIMEQGDAAWITAQMVSQQKIFDAYISLLLHGEWSVRLGAMVVVEELSETDPDLARTLSPVLIEQFDRHDIAVQGDILYALGCTGGPGTKEWIKEHLSDFSHEDLRDAAQDAMDALDEKAM